MWRPMRSKPGPGCLHSHSVVKFLNTMILFGGELDYGLWKDNFPLCSVSRMWRPVRSKPGPGCLHSHSAVKFLNAMILFGGEREGQTLNELWKFHFGKYKERSLKGTVA